MPTFASTTGRQMPKIEGTGSGGAFIRQANLLGELIIITPVKVEIGKFNEGKPDERETKKLIADVVVLTGANAGEHPGVWISGGKLIELGQTIIDQKLDSVIAGRMIRQPLKKYRTAWPTPEALEEAIADPKVVVPSNAYAWLVPNASAEDTAMIQEYYASGTIPSVDENDDPFDD